MSISFFCVPPTTNNSNKWIEQVLQFCFCKIIGGVRAGTRECVRVFGFFSLIKDPNPRSMNEDEGAGVRSCVFDPNRPCGGRVQSPLRYYHDALVDIVRCYIASEPDPAVARDAALRRHGVTRIGALPLDKLCSEARRFFFLRQNKPLWVDFYQGRMLPRAQLPGNRRSASWVREHILRAPNAADLFTRLRAEPSLAEFLFPVPRGMRLLHTLDRVNTLFATDLSAHAYRKFMASEKAKRRFTDLADKVIAFGRQNGPEVRRKLGCVLGARMFFSITLLGSDKQRAELLANPEEEEEEHKVEQKQEQSGHDNNDGGIRGVGRVGRTLLYRCEKTMARTLEAYLAQAKQFIVAARRGDDSSVPLDA